MSTTEKATRWNLVLVVILLGLAISWSVLSLHQELICVKGNGWFARSGAILLIASIWSAVITRPFIADSHAPDYAAYYKSALNESDPPEPHWTLKYKIPSILLGVELALSIYGTVLWAYGDTWLFKC